MKNTWTLARALIKNNYPFTRKGILIVLAVAVCLVPAFIQLVFLYEGLIRARMVSQTLSLAFLINCSFGCFTVLFAFPSIFYFARDTRTLLALPLAPYQIVTAKMIMIWLSQMVGDVVFLLPLWYAWRILPFDLAGWILLVVVSLTIMFVPLFIIAIFVLVAMRLMPFFANRDRFNLVFSLITLVVALGVGLISGFSTGSQANLLDLVLGTVRVPTGPFFQIPWGVAMIMSHSISDGLLYFGSILIFGVLFWWCASRFYLPVAASMNDQASRVRSRLRARSASRSYLIVEFRRLVRSPSYLINLVLGAFLPPLLISGMIIWLWFSEPLPELSEISLLHEWWFWLMGGMVAGLFFSSSAGISATAFSREGQGLPFLKSLPIRLEEQVRLKMLIGFGISTLAGLFTLVIPILFGAGPIGILAYLAAMILAILAGNLIAISIDAFHPKLVWDSETTAVKNNFNSVLGLIADWLLIVLFVGILWLIGFERLQTGILVLTVLLVLIDGILWFAVPTFSARSLGKIS